MYDTTKPYNEKIAELVKLTWHTMDVDVVDGMITKKFSLPEFHHCDGIGTKGDYHWKQRTFREAVLDAFYMNLNDLPLARARPYALVDHIMLPADDHEAILEIMQNLSDECVYKDIAITGGETAIHTNMSGLEISISMLGVIERQEENKCHEGDVLVGLRSNGLHSNGFTKVRELFGEEIRPEFTRATKGYWNDISYLDREYGLNGMMHITGGAFTKLKKIIGENDAIIHRNHAITPPQIFQEIYSKGVGDEEMYKTFNCGIGFIFSVHQKEFIEMTDFLRGIGARAIGTVKAGSGKVRIESMFSDTVVEY